VAGFGGADHDAVAAEDVEEHTLEGSSASALGRRLRGHARGLSAEEKINRGWNTEIANRRTALGILRVYERHRSEFCATNIATAMNRLAKCADGADVARSSTFADFATHAGQLVISSGGVRNLSNTFWALAKLWYDDDPLSNAIASQSLLILTEFEPQGLSNLAWSCATLQFVHSPCIAAISAPAIRKLRHFDAQNIGNTSWAFARLQVTDEPLMTAIA